MTARSAMLHHPVSVCVLCGLAVVISALPVLLNTHPPLIDYPFYIARIFILSELGSNPFLAEHYAVSSFLIPNIGAEIVVLPLVRLFSYEIAFDVFVILVFVLIVSGSMFLHASLFARPSLWPLISSVFLINWMFLFGFLNYMLGVGVFLWAFAGWIRLSRKPWAPRILYGAVVSTILFFVHLASLGLYVAAVAGFEGQRALGALRQRQRTSAFRVLAAAAPCALQFLPPIALFLLSPTREAGVADSGLGGVEYALAQKAFAPVVTLSSGDFGLDLLAAATLLAAGALILAFGRIVPASSACGPLAALVLAYLLLPHHLGQAQFVDGRIPIAMLFVLIASLQISIDRPFAAGLTIALLAGLLGVKSVVLAREWQKHDELIGSYTEAFARLPRESTLFFAAQRAPRSWANRHYAWRMRSPPHVADLATLTGTVFAPSVFAYPGQHTIEVRAPFDRVKRYQGPDPIEVRDSAELAGVIRDLVSLHGKVADRHPAFLLLLDRGTPPIPLPEDTRLIESGSGFRVIEIYRPAGATVG